jgi:hypothetical protein
MFLTGAGVAVTFGAGVGVTVGDVHPLTETTIMPININNNNAFVIFLVNVQSLLLHLSLLCHGMSEHN